MEGPKIHLTGGPLDHRPFGRLRFVNLDGPNYAIWTKEPSSLLSDKTLNGRLTEMQYIVKILEEDMREV